ncbi:MAG: dephospho-CoA kinase [Bacteroidales bacterium]|nr:dephospho-CoA kinase [Bacteroidales bacterium]
MICLVCTGGIGSGKSYAIKVFKALGVPSYIADQRAKELYETDSVLLDELVSWLGKGIIREGRLDKREMALRIFPNPNLLKKVNEIVHPRVLSDFLIWRESQKSMGEEVVVFESAIFFETPIFHGIEDKVIVVTAPEDVRIKRVMKRDGITEDEVRERMSRQCSDEERLKEADFVIYTDGIKAVLPQISEILKSVKEKV